MRSISVFAPSDPSHARLTAAAGRIAEASGLDCEVKTVYYDLGQGMMWTTIIGYPGDGRDGVQILSPRLQEHLLCGDEDLFHDAIAEAVAVMIRLHRSCLAADAAVQKRKRE